MVKKRAEFELIIKPRLADKKLKQILPTYIADARKTLQEFGQMLEDDFKDLIPVRSGDTKRSVKLKSRIGRKDLNARYTITGSENVNRLDKGTRPSPGVYLDFLGFTAPLGRRLINPPYGRHGGMKGKGITRTFKSHVQVKQDQLNKELLRKLTAAARKVMK